MSTQKKSSTDKNEYEGRKDEYGGTMTGTGYGRQAEDKKEKGKEKEKETDRKTKKEKSEAGDNNGYEDSAKTNGFNEGQGQGGGIAHKNSEKG